MAAFWSRPIFRPMLAFAGLIAGGAALLALPASAAREGGVSFLDALFTATSAVCVTGLAVVDTGSDYSPLGQFVILGLIQLGGLGILTLSNWVLLAFGPKKLQPADRLVVESLHGRLPGIDTRRLLRQVVAFTLTWETLGAVALFVRFRRDFPAGEALWNAVFHSVSAFCNAGFSLFSDSLTRYRGDAWVNGVVAVLVVGGGLGFIVFTDIFRTLRSRTRRTFTLHTKIVLLSTAVLLTSGGVLFFALEWSNPLDAGSAVERVLSAGFLSVTARTAGFNTVPTGELSNAALMLLLLFMFVGASPGSTGGGIKTTTASLLGVLFLSRVRGRSRCEVWGRTIPRTLVTRALVVTTSFVALIMLGTLLLELFETRGFFPVQARGRFLQHLFEVTSAVCTVGLSTGVTSGLGAASRIVIIACMFVGRLGPLLIAESLVGSGKELPYRYPEERVLVG